MFSFQNKQVTTKFQSAHQKVSSIVNLSTKMKPKSLTTATTTTTATTRAASAAKVGDEAKKKLTTASDAASSLHKLNPTSVQGISKILVKPCPDSPTLRLASNASSSSGSRKIKFKNQDNISSRMRIIAGALPRGPQSQSNRIYRPSSSKIFDYDLSKEEAHFFGQYRTPMKSVPADELQLLKSGKRSTYLETRYAHTPDAKYNYPEATSWRYGWFHQAHAAAK